MPRITPRIADDNAIIRELASYSSPDAVREYVTNAVDNLLVSRLKRNVIHVLFDTSAKRQGMSYPRLVIQDGGTGFSWQKLNDVPGSVGVSEKRGDDYTRGEKAIGLWAYGSFNDHTRMTIQTRPHTSVENAEVIYGIHSNEAQSSRLARGMNAHLSQRKTDGGNPYYVAEWPSMAELTRGEEVITSTVRENELRPRGGFDHGTRIVIGGVPKGKIDYLRKNLPRSLQTTYHPLLAGGSIEIYVGNTTDAKSQKPVKPITFNGEPIFEDTITIQYEGEDGVERRGKMEFHIYYTEDTASGPVNMYSKGVLVTPVTTGFETSTDGFAAPEITGFGDENFLTPDVKRTSYRGNALREEVENEISKINDKVKKELRKKHAIRTPGRGRVEEVTDKFLSNLNIAWREIYKTMTTDANTFALGTSTDPRKPVSPTGGLVTTIFEGESTGSPKTPRGRPAYTEDANGGQKNVRKGNRLLSYTVNRMEFPVDERAKSSKLDPTQGVIHINTAYKERTGDEDRIIRHDLGEIATQVAFGEIEKLAEDAGIVDLGTYQRDWVPTIRADLFARGIKDTGLDY
jgi:hypothetical protein